VVSSMIRVNNTFYDKAPDYLVDSVPNNYISFWKHNGINEQIVGSCYEFKALFTNASYFSFGETPTVRAISLPFLNKTSEGID